MYCSISFLVPFVLQPRVVLPEIDPMPQPVHQHRPPRMIRVFFVRDRPMRRGTAHEKHDVTSLQQRVHDSKQTVRIVIIPRLIRRL